MKFPREIDGVLYNSLGQPIDTATEPTKSSQLQSLLDRLHDLERERLSVLRKIARNHIGYEPQNIHALLNLYLS